MELLLCLLMLILSIKFSEQHGYLAVPPSRSSLWREGFDSPVNYNDNEINCGGRAKIQKLDGLCGVCGDPNDGPHDNEAGGRYVNGIIGRRYELGIPYIQTTVELTAYHKGFFEFRICPHDNPSERVKQECLDRYQLQIAESENDLEAAKLKYYPPSPGEFNLTVVLPVGLRCTQCVMQWRYKTGNSWGVDKNGTGCTGCGIQEEFRNCADISIGGDDVNANVMPSNKRTISVTETTRKPKTMYRASKIQKQPKTDKTRFVTATSINTQRQNEHPGEGMHRKDHVNRFMKLPNYMSRTDNRNKSNLINSYITIVPEAIRNMKAKEISRSIKIDHKELQMRESPLDVDTYIYGGKGKFGIDKTFKSSIKPNTKKYLYGKSEKAMMSQLKRRYKSLQKSKLDNESNWHNFLRYGTTDWKKIDNGIEHVQKARRHHRYDFNELDNNNKIAEDRSTEAED